MDVTQVRDLQEITLILNKTDKASLKRGREVLNDYYKEQDGKCGQPVVDCMALIDKILFELQNGQWK